jgi:ferredoxin
MEMLTKYFNKYLEDKFAACPIEVNHERCMAVNEYCQEACVQSCPTQAIAKGKKSIDESSCHGCGCCVTTCSNGALGFKNLKDETLIRNVLHNSKGKTAFRFGCNHSYQHHLKNDKFAIDQLASLEVDCLARLYEGILLLPLTAGVNQVWIDTAACADCSKNRAAMVVDCIKANFDYSINWLTQLGIDKSRLAMAAEPPDFVLAEAKVINEKLNNLDRRAFFTHCGNGIKSKAIGIAGDLADHVLPDQDKKERMALKPNQRKNSPPFHREVLLAVNKKLVQPQEIDKQLLEFPEMIIGQQCKLCNICSRLCPTGAIEQYKDEENKRGSVIYQPAKCIHCGKCMDKCFEKQLSFTSSITNRVLVHLEEMIVYQADLVKCMKCKDYYPLPLAKDELCPICSKIH